MIQTDHPKRTPAEGNTPLQMISRAWAAGRFSKALDLVRQLSAEERNQFQVMAYEADLHGKLGDHQREIELLHKLIADEPRMASLRLSLGHALKTLGRTGEAVDAYRQAIDIQPNYGKAWWCLSDLKSFRFDDAEIAAMEQALTSEVSDADLLHLHFALGKAYEDRGDPARSFEYYRLGNAVRAASIPPAAASVSAQVDLAIQALTGEFLQSRAGFGNPSDEPIFIVGLQRAGTTLIEQILASHPDIEGTSELPILPQILRKFARDDTIPGRNLMEKIASLEPERLAELGQAYLDGARAYRMTERPRFIDKLPTNWMHVGIIRLILPNARIIDARRHPMAVGFSNFKQNYGAGAGWSYTLPAIGRHYRDYLRMMRHFDAVQPGAVHRLVNERLIEHFEPEVRRLLDYVGVTFDAHCLEFHRTKRPVRSASAEQVRRPISREGIDQWRAYERWLGPLKEALGPALTDWDQP